MLRSFFSLIAGFCKSNNNVLKNNTTILDIESGDYDQYDLFITVQEPDFYLKAKDI